jgi:hypothetical protein
VVAANGDPGVGCWRACEISCRLARIISVDVASGRLTFVGSHLTVVQLRMARVCQIQMRYCRYALSAGPTYQPSTPCGDQEECCDLSSYATTLVPGGAIGVALKLKEPKRPAQADKVGLMREPRSKLRVSSACGISSSHWSKGKSLSVLQRPAIK